MRIGIIGSSGHVGYVFESLRNGADAVVAGLAPGSDGEDMASVEATARDAGSQPALFPDPETLLDRSRPEAVVVASHFYDHARIACTVLDRGLPCFLEKPFALTLDDLARLLAAQARSGALLMPMLGLRYAPAVFTAWKAVSAGAIGQVRLFTAQKSYKLGKRPGFYSRRSTYGGTIPWVGSHAVDWMLWFSGKQPLSVWASHSSRFNGGNGDMEMSALCHFALEDEVMAGINIDYLRPTGASSHDDDRIRVAGTRGVVEVRAGKAILTSDERGGETELRLENPGRIFDDFLAAVRGERRPLCDHEDGFRATRACLLARQSADERKVIGF